MAISKLASPGEVLAFVAHIVVGIMLIRAPFESPTVEVVANGVDIVTFVEVAFDGVGIKSFVAIVVVV